MSISDLFKNKSSKRGYQQNVEAEVGRFIEDPDRPSPTAIIYQSELDYISRCILDYPNIETGGQLFGFWTSMGTPVVMYAIGPGRYAQHNPTSFVQDQAYLQTVGIEIHKRYRLQHIGEWHSHHQLGLAHPSGGDVNTMRYGVGKPGFPRLLLCIGNCTRTQTTLNAFNFHENTPREYVHANWDIVPTQSPYRAIIDADLKYILIHPFTRRASHGQLQTRSNVREESHIRTHWLTQDVANVDMMKAFVSTVRELFPNRLVKAEVIETGEPQIALKGENINIRLPYGFPDKGPVLVDDRGRVLDTGIRWELEEMPLKYTFDDWVRKVLNFTSYHKDAYLCNDTMLNNDAALNNTDPYIKDDSNFTDRTQKDDF